MFSAQSRLRHAAADTFAMVVYCSVVNMMIEIFLSGMTFEQSLSSRLVAIPVNIIIAWPYVLILLSVGADWHQILAAVSSNAVVSLVMGAAYGYFLDFCRRLFRVEQYTQAKA